MGHRLRASILLVLTGSVSGCITMSYVPEIGVMNDESPVIERAVATDDAVLIASRVTATKIGGRVIAFDVPRWSRVDLDTLSWQRLTEARDGPGPCRQIEMERTNPPAALVSSDRDVPILPLSEASVVGRPGGTRELIDLAAPYPISLHPRLARGALTVVRHDLDHPTSLRDAEVCLTSRRYHAWWAVPARIAVVPATIAADAVTLPLQAGLLVWVFVDGPNWHW